ncbi:voltage-gated hydrogen channel 1 [Exaiptasia diaphana]|uniref:Voltage-gated hydrogen channel 1 n=1 Tax=Exaiptasia diaphana TaxID=2652724 RepID=A0A913Y8G2_EXADI|nr:voltage-gated hydrogen channel 1 [Exaiptasia diaphana]KXJ19649.1 Voltage-gated hydrogen channel 1 [Exaiptasia diaphana]
MASRDAETAEDGKRSTFHDAGRRRDTREWMRGCCGVLQRQFGEMLTGVTWQMTIILLVLIEVVINIILLLISFHVIKDSEDHFASNILHFVAISILSLFVLEIALKLFALGFRFFLTEKWELFDATIVLVAFTTEIILRVMHAETWRGLELTIALRLWRVLRLVSVMISFKEEFYELIDDEIDGKRKNEPKTETSEVESLRDKHQEN